MDELAIVSHSHRGRYATVTLKPECGSPKSMSVCAKCGWAMGSGERHDSASPICQSCVLAEATLDAEVAALAQPDEEERRDQLIDEYADGGLEGIAIRHMLRSKESRKIAAFGCLGVVAIALVAGLVVDRVTDTAPKLSVASALAKRKPGVLEILEHIRIAGKRAVAEDLASPPAEALADGVVLNFSGQPGDATATILDVRQIMSEGTERSLSLFNPRFEGAREILAPMYATGATDAAERIKRVKYVRYHASWLDALRYLVIVRDVAFRNGMSEGLALVYQVEGGELIANLPFLTTDSNLTRVVQSTLASRFKVFDERGHIVRAP